MSTTTDKTTINMPEIREHLHGLSGRLELLRGYL